MQSWTTHTAAPPPLLTLNTTTDLSSWFPLLTLLFPPALTLTCLSHRYHIPSPTAILANPLVHCTQLDQPYGQQRELAMRPAVVCQTQNQAFSTNVPLAEKGHQASRQTCSRCNIVPMIRAQATATHLLLAALCSLYTKHQKCQMLLGLKHDPFLSTQLWLHRRPDAFSTNVPLAEKGHQASRQTCSRCNIVPMIRAQATATQLLLAALCSLYTKHQKCQMLLGLKHDPFLSTQLWLHRRPDALNKKNENYVQRVSKCRKTCHFGAQAAMTYHDMQQSASTEEGSKTYVHKKQLLL